MYLPSDAFILKLFWIPKRRWNMEFWVNDINENYPDSWTLF